MRIVLLTNAASGRGGSHSLASQAATVLERDGHEVVRVALGPGWEAGVAAAAAMAGGVGLLVACGGDGTVSAAAGWMAARPSAAKDTAIYHLALGTENLFAREFGMRPDVDQLAAAVRAWSVERCDLGECRAIGGSKDVSRDDTARTFVLMCSVGFDADVLHALAARRKGPISHGSYTRPVIDCLLRPTIRTLTIEVDGRVVVEGVKGNVVVSNCGRYALGLDPSREASMTDGRLDVFFAPSGSSVRTIAWMGLALARMGRNACSIVRARGERVTVRVQQSRGASGAYQLDGEAIGGSGNTLDMRVRPGVLRVLRPVL